MFEIKPIPEDKPRGWKIYADGNELKANHLVISSERHGAVTYGLDPRGWDAWFYEEPNGGGATILPYTRSPSGELMVGLVSEKRPNIGEEPVFCIAGGFIDKNETHAQAQAREAAEEINLETTKARRLQGVPTNSNRAFFVTDISNDKGVQAYSIHIPYNLLEGDGDRMKLKKTALLPNIKNDSDLRFFLWRKAVRMTPDALARAAIAQLLAEVYK